MQNGHRAAPRRPGQRLERRAERSGRQFGHRRRTAQPEGVSLLRRHRGGARDGNSNRKHRAERGGLQDSRRMHDPYPDYTTIFIRHSPFVLYWSSVSYQGRRAPSSSWTFSFAILSSDSYTDDSIPPNRGHQAFQPRRAQPINTDRPDTFYSVII